MNARLPVVLAAAALLAACAHVPPPSRSPIAQWEPSPNFDARKPMLIVIHATEEGSAEQALHTLRTANSGGPVSAHYLVGSDGRIYQLVDDADRAWQAGAGRWGTITELNSASIGIELDNDGETPFAPAEIDALIRLLDDLCTRLGIPRDAIIAHADLAPARKRDPGFRFPWKQLADAGFGKWPQGPLVDPPPGFDPLMALRVLGYPLEIDKTPGYTDTVRAFHRHYRGDENDVLDAEDARILYAMTKLSAASGEASSADAGPMRSMDYCEGNLASARNAYDTYRSTGKLEVPFHEADLVAMFGKPEQLSVFKGPGLTAALAQAAFADNVDNVKTLIAMGADVKGVDARGNAALAYTAECDAAAAAAVLLDAGADPYAKSQGGGDALMRAVASGSPNVVRVLLDSGMDPCRNTNRTGRTAPDIAARVGFSDPPLAVCPPGKP